MIVISAGMQRAASASYFNLINDLLVAEGYRGVHQLRSQFGFGFFMTSVNCNIGPLRAYKLMWLSLPHWLGQSFVAKTHEPPSPSLRAFLSLGIAKAAYIYRDPRDVAVSLCEYGARLRKSGRPSNTQFDKLEDMSAAIQFTARLIPTWRSWTTLQGVHVVRFEDFVQDPLAETTKLSDYLELQISSQKAQRVAHRYKVDTQAEPLLPQGSHFQKGRSGRWKTKMNEDEQALSKALFGDQLLAMGYEW